MWLYPNPTEGIINCSASGGSTVKCQRVTWKIYDMYGKEVRTLADGMYQNGEYHLQVNVSDLPAGVYLVRLQAGGKSVVRKLIVK